MSAITERFHHGPVTYSIAESVNGGQFVEPSASGGAVVVAADRSTTVLGVAVADGDPGEVTDNGFQVNAAFDRPNLAVAVRGAYRLEVGAGGLAAGTAVAVGSDSGTGAQQRHGLAVQYDPSATGATAREIVGRSLETVTVSEGQRALILLS